MQTSERSWLSRKTTSARAAFWSGVRLLIVTAISAGVLLYAGKLVIWMFVLEETAPAPFGPVFTMLLGLPLLAASRLTLEFVLRRIRIAKEKRGHHEADRADNVTRSQLR